MRTATMARVYPRTFSAREVRDLHAMNARVCRDLAADPHRRPRPGIDKSPEQLLIEAADHEARVVTAGPMTLWFWTYEVPNIGSTTSGGQDSPEKALGHLRRSASESGVALPAIDVEAATPDTLRPELDAALAEVALGWNAEHGGEA
jgi:hypothetical protein